jgi:hypothetical protein
VAEGGGLLIRESISSHFLTRLKGSSLLSFLISDLVTNNIRFCLSGFPTGALTSGVRPQQAKLDFATESLLDVARSLRFKLADAGLNPEEIRASGLGYANLLYRALFRWD